jgi:hypothetical protein
VYQIVRGPNASMYQRTLDAMGLHVHTCTERTHDFRHERAVRGRCVRLLEPPPARRREPDGDRTDGVRPAARPRRSA